jgi:hypothetical protein
VNHDDIGLEGVDPWREYEVKGYPTKKTVALANRAVQKHPGYESQEMGPRQVRNAMPVDRAFPTFATVEGVRITERKVFDSLRVQVDLAVILMGEPIYQLRHGAFGPMAAVDRRGNHG